MTTESQIFHFVQNDRGGGLWKFFRVVRVYDRGGLVYTS